MSFAFSLLAGAAGFCVVLLVFPRVRSIRALALDGLRHVHGGTEGGRSFLSGFMAARRLEGIRGQLPGGLLAMSTSVRAGLSLAQALSAAGERLGGQLGAELGRVAGDTAMGGTMESALAGFERRVALPEVRMLVAGLNLARTTGASLAPLLERIAETLRERERMRGQLRALTAQGRLSGWVVGLTPVALLMVMGAVDPGFVRPLFTTPAGLLLLGVAVVLEALGALAIRAVVRVEA
jgi:tight adherence protein B